MPTKMKAVSRMPQLTIFAMTLLLCFLTTMQAFTSPITHHHHYISTSACEATKPKSDSFLLDDFKLSNGEILDPYKILKVSRSAPKTEIKKSYYMMSRRYHPDGVRHRDILPGACNNHDDVREHWEKIRLSYEILKNEKSRKKYDRHKALADPGAALQRAAVDAAVSGVLNVGKGIFGLGVFAVKSVVKQSKVSSTNSNNNGAQQERQQVAMSENAVQ